MVVLPPGTGGFLAPVKIIESLGVIQKGMKVADFGCGHGYFTIPLAKKVGESGKIYAIDVVPETLEAVNSRMKTEGIKNIEIKRGNLEKNGGSCLEEESCDIVFIANLLFQAEEDEKIVQEAKRILKPSGRVIFIEWRQDAPLGPIGKRVKAEEAKKLFENENLLFEKTFATDNYHYGLIFIKKED